MASNFNFFLVFIESHWSCSLNCVVLKRLSVQFSPTVSKQRRWWDSRRDSSRSVREERSSRRSGLGGGSGRSQALWCRALTPRLRLRPFNPESEPPEPEDTPPRPLTGQDQSRGRGHRPEPGGPSALGSSPLRPDKSSQFQARRKTDEDFSFHLGETDSAAVLCREKRRSSGVAWTLQS